MINTCTNEGETYCLEWTSTGSLSVASTTVNIGDSPYSEGVMMYWGISFFLVVFIFFATYFKHK